MPVHTSKHNFTAGEISPLMEGRIDFDRFKNGCHAMRNMVALTQGPTGRRSGFEFMYDLTSLGVDTSDPQIRLVPFVFNKKQAYALVIFKHTSGAIRTVFASGDGLVVYDDPAITECPAGTPVAPTPGDIVYLDLPSAWDIGLFDYAQSGDVLYTAQPELKPHVINRYGHTCWTVEEITFQGQPVDWSDLLGWPESVSFYQQRLAFGGTQTYRQKVWTSKAGDFTKFDPDGATLVGSDPVAFTLDSESQNQIQWMQAVKRLNIGTIGNEWVVYGNNQSAITPTTGVLTESPTSQGSEKIKPLRVGLSTLFVENQGRVVNEFTFDFNYDSNKASDLTVLASHLTEDYSIVRWTYQQTPHSIVWCVREDGALLGLTYQRPHNVVAWHRHDTQGEFIDVCSIPGDRREDDLWAVVKRVVNGADKYYLERKAPSHMPALAQDGSLLDSYLRYEGVATDTLTGLDHLEGLEVHVLADGYAHPNRVVNGGSITLNNEATNVLVGLSYTSEVSPLMPDVPLNDGSSLNREQKTIAIYARLYRSLGFDVGYVFSNGEDTWFPTLTEVIEEQSFRTPTDPTSSALPLFTGVRKLDGIEGFDSASQIVFRQTQPFPLNIISITKKVEVK